MQTPSASAQHPAHHGIFEPKSQLIGAIVAGVLLVAGAICHNWLEIPNTETLHWGSLAIGLFFGGKAAWDVLREGKFDIDVLMIIAAVLSAAVGHPEEGALLLFLFTLAGALEDLAMERTQREVEALHALMPKGALVLRNDEWVETDAESLVAGERVKVRPGERVPVDAKVVLGATSLDQSTITGESIPREVEVGDEIYAGTINADNAIEAVVLRPAKESSIQKILNLVTQAREQKEPVQQIIDRIGQWYSIGVMVLSVTVFLFWWLILKREVMPAENRGSGALMTAITLLIVASPCALVIATPTATLAAIARAARAGVLFKGGSALSRLAGISAMCVDKTGTLTFGRPKMYEVHPVAWSNANELLSLAAGLEADSTHPIAQAIRDAANERGLVPTKIEKIDNVIARGLEATHHGARVRLGRYAFVEELIPVCFRNRVQEVLSKIQHRGHIGVVIARQDANAPDGGEAAVLIMSDSVRPGADTLTRELHALGVKPLRMLTGDNRATAQRVAEALKLDAFDAELLPADKLRIIGEMKQLAAKEKTGVALIGDGVNDAPALAAASVGLAIGTIGTAAALESADVVLLSDSLSPVPWSIKLARKARTIVHANLTVALGVILIMGVATLIGSYLHRPIPLAIGVLAHEGGTILVVLNSLRLLWFKALKVIPKHQELRSKTAALSPIQPANS
ncbi:MAG: cation-translocating P-type ATPase [Phycisphaerales bacterium]